jgi:hypothetical protein
METIKMIWKDYLKNVTKRAQQYKETYVLYEREDHTHREYRERDQVAILAEPGIVLAEIFGEPLQEAGVIVVTHRIRVDLVSIHQDKPIFLVTDTPWLYDQSYYPIPMEKEFPIGTRVIAPHPHENDELEGRLAEGVVQQHIQSGLPSSSQVTGVFINFEDGTEPVEFETGFLSLLQLIKEENV